jgi:hypothetical protein
LKRGDKIRILDDGGNGELGCILCIASIDDDVIITSGAWVLSTKELGRQFELVEISSIDRGEAVMPPPITRKTFSSDRRNEFAAIALHAIIGKHQPATTTDRTTIERLVKEWSRGAVLIADALLAELDRA